MRIAVCQVNSRDDRAANLAAAHRAARSGRRAGADFAVLPEYVDYLGPADGEPKPEPVDGEFAAFFADAARRYGMWVLAGSFHETGPDARTPTTPRSSSTASGRWPRRTARSTSSTSTSPSGSAYQESRPWRPARPVTVDVDGVRVGLTICYDLRFPELYRQLADRRRPGAAGAGRVHHAHRAGPLGGAAAGPGDREPVLRGRRRTERRPRSRARAASAAAWSSIRGARWWPRPSTGSACVGRPRPRPAGPHPAGAAQPGQPPPAEPRRASVAVDGQLSPWSTRGRPIRCGDR